MIPKCAHCPVAGACIAFPQTCAAIKDDPAKAAEFAARNVEAMTPELEAKMRDWLAATDLDHPGGVGWVPPVGGCCG